MTVGKLSFRLATIRFARWLLAGLLGMAVIVDATPPESSQEMAGSLARATVDHAHQALIQSMKDGDRVSFEERFDQLEPVISGSFDIPYIAEVALGKHMDALDEGQREQFIEVFRRFMVANYAHNFSEYEGQQFTFRDELKQREDIVVIRTHFTGGEGQRRDFDYQLRRRQNRWLIVNVAVDGVSDLALKRTQYDAVIRKDGFNALVERLNARIAEMSNESAN